MFSIRRSLPVSIGIVALALTACTTTEPRAPDPMRPPVTMPPPVLPAPLPAPLPEPVPAVPPAAQLMTPVPFASLPGWQQDDLRQAWPAFMTSCAVLVRKEEWKPACLAARTVAAGDHSAVRRYFERWFVANQVRSADGSDTGLITGYYEASLRGARKRGGAFQTPLYAVPDDLLTVELSDVYPDLKNKRVRGKLVGRKIVPYSARAEMGDAKLAGKELLYVDDPVEAFFLEVQGSGRVQLADAGETVRLSYADQNGHPYKAIGRWLVEQGELTQE